MTTSAISPTVLGHAAEQAVVRDHDQLAALLRRLPSSAWSQSTPAGSDVAHVVAHLTGGARRLADSWGRRLDPEPTALQHPIHDPGTGEVTAVPDRPDDLLAAYDAAVGRLRRVLGSCRLEDWVWPVWSPLGGTETLASATRRWVAHHRVHHHDLATGVGASVAPDDLTDTLLTEFVLDAVARRGGPAVDPPFRAEIVVAPPGAGTWTMIVEDPRQPEELPPLWLDLLTPDELREHYRLERGSGDASVIVRCDGEVLWRAAFRRGATWRDLSVHGDDGSKRQWRRLVETLASDADRIGRVQA